jgi:hypothetical protein
MKLGLTRECNATDHCTVHFLSSWLIELLSYHRLLVT